MIDLWFKLNCICPIVKFDWSQWQVSKISQLTWIPPVPISDSLGTYLYTAQCMGRMCVFQQSSNTVIVLHSYKKEYIWGHISSWRLPRPWGRLPWLWVRPPENSPGYVCVLVRVWCGIQFWTTSPIKVDHKQTDKEGCSSDKAVATIKLVDMTKVVAAIKVVATIKFVAGKVVVRNWFFTTIMMRYCDQPASKMEILLVINIFQLTLSTLPINSNSAN